MILTKPKRDYSDKEINKLISKIGNDKRTNELLEKATRKMDKVNEIIRKGEKKR